MAVRPDSGLGRQRGDGGDEGCERLTDVAGIHVGEGHLEGDSEVAHHIQGHN